MEIYKGIFSRKIENFKCPTDVVRTFKHIDHGQHTIIREELVKGEARIILREGNLESESCSEIKIIIGVCKELRLIA